MRLFAHGPEREADAELHGPSRTIVRRVPLKEPYPMTNHDQQSGQEFDFLNVSGMQLRRLQFQLCFADGTVIPPRGHVSFSLLFAVIE